MSPTQIAAIVLTGLIVAGSSALHGSSVVGWGDNRDGQGDPPADLTNAVAIAAGGHHSLALLANGSVVGWGRDEYGQSRPPSSLTNAVAIAAGGYHSLAVTTEGRIVRWGYPVDYPYAYPGEMVLAVDAAWESGAALYEYPGYVHIRGFGDLLPLQLTPTNFVGVAAGDNYLLGLHRDGTLSGIGNNDRGQLDFPPDLMGIRLLAANGQHNLAVIESGQVLGWGDNSYGQATPPPGLVNPKAIDCGRRHSLAIAPDDTVVVWGDNGLGQCAVPEGLTNVFAVAGGDAHSLALVGPVPPFVTRPPRATTIYANNAAELDAIVLGSEPLFFQWQHQGTNVPGANGRSLRLEMAQPGQSGQYRLLITNSAGMAVSAPAELTVLGVPSMVHWDPWTSSALPDMGHVISISGGSMHFLALREDGTVVAWGKDQYGVLDVPSDLREVVDIDAGGRHNLALRRDGTVSAWGNPEGPEVQVPVGLDRVVKVSAGVGQSLALRDDGTVAAWGQYYGNGPAGTAIGPLRDIVDVAVSSFSSAALMDRGTVLMWWWGDHGGGRVVKGLTNVIAIEAKDNRLDLFTALHDDGTVSQLYGDSIYLYGFPVARTPGYTNLAAVLPGGPLCLTHEGDVPGLPLPPESYHARDIASSGLGQIALMGDGSPVISVPPRPRWTWIGNTLSLHVKAVGVPPLAYQWLRDGREVAGAIRDSLLFENIHDEDEASYSVRVRNVLGTVTSSPVPVTVGPVAGWGHDAAGQSSAPHDLGDIVALKAGDRHSLALRADGTVVAWGDDASEQCQVPEGLPPIVSVAAGKYHSLALTRNGSVVTWGGTLTNRSTLTVPPDLPPAVAIAAGDDFSVALCADGRVKVWGLGADGSIAVPEPMPLIVAVAAGPSRVLALSEHGTVVEWGEIEVVGIEPGPEPMPPLQDIVGIAAGDNHSLALTRSGTVIAWGLNFYENIDIARTLTRVIAISAGGDHSVALRADGTVVAWGADFNGQSTPPLHLHNVIAIAAGREHSLALVAERPVAVPLITAARSASNQIVFDLPTTPGWYDTVEWSNGLLAPRWIMTAPRPGDGTTRSWWVEPQDSLMADRFYRVRRWQP